MAEEKSEWVKVRDEIVNAVDVEEVTEELKQSISKQLLDNVIPAVELALNKFIVNIEKQAAHESGWNKLRDSVVLPLAIRGTFSIVKLITTKSLTKA